MTLATVKTQVAASAPAIPEDWGSQLNNLADWEDTERSWWSIGGRPTLLPTLAAAVVMADYAAASAFALEDIALKSTPSEQIEFQAPSDIPVTGSRISRFTEFGKLERLATWMGLRIPTEDGGSLNLEEMIRAAGPLLYESPDNRGASAPKERPHRSFLDILTSFAGVAYHRSGHHRLPAQLPESLRRNDRRLNKVAFDDAMSLQDWWIKQMSAILGEFPVKIEMSVNGETQTLEAKSLAEILSEVWGLGLDGVVQSDRQNAYNTVILGQALEAHIAALQARDFAAGNADYLGYKADVTEKDLTLAFDPAQKNPQQFFTESTQKILGWKNVDPATASEFFAAINQATELLKLAATRPIERGQPVSDAIERVKGQDRQAWEEYILRYRNPQPSDLPVEPDAQTFNRRITDISNNAGGE